MTAFFRFTCLMLLLAIATKSSAQTLGSDNDLGIGLLTFSSAGTRFYTKPVALYTDSLCKALYTDFTLAQTNCPTCMFCAEPQDFYKGKIDPFICGGGNGH